MSPATVNQNVGAVSVGAVSNRDSGPSRSGLQAPPTTARPIFADPARAAALLRELDSWLGTPWAHRANVCGAQLAVKGEGGDCVTIPLTALYNLALVAPLELPAHVVAPGLLRDDEVAESITSFVLPYVNGRQLRVVDFQREPLLVGDFLAFRLRAGRAHHLGIYRGGADRLFYHAPGPGDRFVIESLHQTGAYLSHVYRLLEPAGLLSSDSCLLTPTPEAA